jgi:protein phosphatase PTC2/3
VEEVKETDKRAHKHKSRTRSGINGINGSISDCLGEQAGCTASVVLITPKQIICANAGDSRTILARRPGQIIPLSRDHRPDNLNERKRIKAAGGFVVQNRVCGQLNLSRALGDFQYKRKEGLSYK